MLKRILFVDDEPLVLNGLKRSLHSMRNEWDMVFARCGDEALQAIDHEHFDIVVTDMQMPGMDGAQLLEEVKKRSPHSLRMILSGQADRETAFRCVDSAHQYVSKPCEGEELKRRLSRAFSLRDLLTNADLKAIVSRLESLPTLPSLYLELNEELNAAEPSLEKVSRIVLADMAVSAKLLQLVNSAFFGLRTRISDASQALRLLGFETLKSLVLSTHVFSQFQAKIFSDADLHYLSQHSVSSANYAKTIAAAENADRRMTDDCFTAALLHDAGQLVMASAYDQQYKTVLEIVRNDGKGLHDAECEVFGCSHSSVGAYLFGLWGLSDRIIEAVAWHHHPADSDLSQFSPLTAVHVASIYHEQTNDHPLLGRTAMDYRFLARTGCLELEKSWRKLLLGNDMGKEIQ